MVVVCFLVLVPAELRIEGKGTLLPQTRREVFAGESGVVRKVLVEHGSRVKAGDVVIELENIDLVVRLQQVRARTVQTRDEIRIKEALRDDRSLSESELIRIDGELNSLNGRCASLHRELVLLESQKERLMVRAPIAGIVTTWEPVHLLAGRPVQTGNRLLSLAMDTDAWVLEIELPEDRIGHVLQARQKLSDGQRLSVEYILATKPEQRYHGWLETIAARAEVTESEDNIVKLTVALKSHETPLLRTGAEVRAHVICGQRSIGYVWFHELSELFYSRVLF